MYFKQFYLGCLAHASYLINLASPDRPLWQRSLDSFEIEFRRAELWTLAQELWPYIVALAVCLALVTYIPGLVLWIPNLVMGAAR